MVKDLPSNADDTGSVPGWGRPPWRKWKSLSHVHSVTPWTIVREIPGQNTGTSSLSLPGIEPRSPTLQADSLPAEPQGKTKNTGVGSLSLLQRIFPNQKLNQCLPHCRQILYQLNYQESPRKWLQYSCLRNPMDKGAYQATVHRVTKELDTT